MSRFALLLKASTRNSSTLKGHHWNVETVNLKTIKNQKFTRMSLGCSHSHLNSKFFRRKPRLKSLKKRSFQNRIPSNFERTCSPQKSSRQTRSLFIRKSSPLIITELQLELTERERTWCAYRLSNQLDCTVFVQHYSFSPSRLCARAIRPRH